MDLERIRERLASKDVRERLHALTAAGDLPVVDRRAAFRIAIKDASPYVAAMAARMLGEVADAEDCAILLDRFEWCGAAGRKRDPGCHIRANIAGALGAAGFTIAAEQLRQALRLVQIEQVGMERRDTGAHLRANAALALGRLRPAGIVRDLALLLFDRAGRYGDEPNPDHGSKVDVRAAAARALAMTCEVEAADMVSLVLAFPNAEPPSVIQDCMAAIVALEDPGAADLLRPYLADESPEDVAIVAYAALMAMRTGDPRVPGWVADAALRLQGDALEVTLVALVTARSPEVEAALLAVAEAPHQVTRRALVAALAEAPSPQTTAVLKRIAEDDPAPAVRQAAAEALPAAET